MLELFTTEVKMKKIFSAICLVAFLALGFFIFAACVPSTNQIDEFGNKLNKADSYEMNVTMEVPVFGLMNYTVKVDDNITYTSSFMGSPAQYTKYEDNVLFTYTEKDGAWYSEISHLYEPDDNTPFSNEQFLALFNGNNYYYSKEEKAFVKKDEVSLDFDGLNFKSLKLELNNNNCKLSGSAIIEGIQSSIILEFKNLGKTTVVLPV